MAARERSAACEAAFECPSCGEQHLALCDVVLRSQPVVFGGGGGAAETLAPWAGPVICPSSQATVECHLMVPVEDGEFVRRLTITEVREVAPNPAPGPAPAPAGGPVAQPDDWISAELADWRKKSMETSRTHATTMLTSSSAAVAVYFTVLKYLGYDSVSHRWGWATIIPPVLFLAAVAAQASALQPALKYVRTEEYAEFRARRIEQIHLRSSIGTGLFLLGLLVSLIVFFLVQRA